MTNHPSNPQSALPIETNPVSGGNKGSDGEIHDDHEPRIRKRTPSHRPPAAERSGPTNRDLPPLLIENVPTSSVKPYGKTLRVHNDKHIAAITGSLSTFGFVAPVLIDDNDVVVDGHALVIAAGRLHEDDLTGHLLSCGGGWRHCPIQARAEEAGSFRTGYGPEDVFHRPVGDILLPEVNSADSLDDIRATTGSINFQAQYQQNPNPADGVIIKREWLRYCDKLPEVYDFVVVSWDTASTIEENSDYSVGTVWGLRGQYFYLIDVLRGRYEAPELRRLIESTHERFEAHQTVIERAGIGHAIGAEMRRQSRIRPVLPTVTTDKTARLIAQSVKFEAQQVILPREAPWLALYLHELLAFPNTRNDDQVDSTSQALRYLATKMAPPVRASRPLRNGGARPSGRIGTPR